MASPPRPIACDGPADLEALLRATFPGRDSVSRGDLFAALNVQIPIDRNVLISLLGPHDPWPIRTVARVLWARSNYAEPDAHHAGTRPHPIPRPAGEHAHAHPETGVLRRPPAPLARPAAGTGDASDALKRIRRLVQLAGALAERLAAVDPDTPESAALIGQWRQFAEKRGRT
jgi:hypothetical protein